MSPVKNLWSKWKALRLPWRKSFLIGKSPVYPTDSPSNAVEISTGSDLSGNTYWEFKDKANAVRLRRIVKTNPNTHIADVQVTPQWHQWLRYVRPQPPSLEEQKQDLIRQEQIKYLARLADERWASKPSYLDKPQSHQLAPATRTTDATMNPPAQPASDSASPGVANAVKSEEEAAAQGKKEDPWAKAKGPSEGWHPESWTPSAAKR